MTHSPDSALRSQCRSILDHCDRIGVSLPHGCRILRVTELVETYLTGPPDIAFRASVEGGETRLALQELSQFRLIVEAFEYRRSQAAYRDKARLAFTKDSFTPSPGAASPGRDAQAELWIAALGIQAGIDMNLRPAPGADLLARIGEECAAIEVKRVRTMNCAIEKLRTARKQLGHISNCPILALDFTELLEQETGILTGLSIEHAFRVQDSALRSILTRYTRAAGINGYASDAIPVGIVCWASGVSLGDLPVLHVAMSSPTICMPIATDNDPRRRLFHFLGNRLLETRG